MRKCRVTAGASAAFLFGCLPIILSGSAFAQVQVNQTFIGEGPSPKSGPVDVVQSGDAGGTNGTTSGAVQAIAFDPTLGPQTLFIGTPLGGVWRSTNDGASWTPLTDNQASLSIASLAIDPSDPTGKTLIAGVGITANGSWDNFNLNGATGRGGARTGLLYSTDGGNTWSALGRSALLGQSVIGVAVDGSAILAATFEEQNPTQTKTNGNSYGLYLSNDGGQTFNLVQAGAGLPSGPVTALVANPQNATNCGALKDCTFYASVTSANTPSTTGVYVSHDSGQTWSAVFTSATLVSGGTNVVTGATTYQLVPKLAAGPNGSIAIAIAQVQPSPPQGNGQQLTGLYLSQNGGGSWSALKVPDVNKGVMQGAVNLAVAIDPKNSSIVYVTGDGIVNTPYTVPAYRVQGQNAASITLNGTSDDSTVHSDSRAIAFDAAGNLWLGTDGGIYMRSNPESSNGSWTGANTSTLQVAEVYSVAYDSLTKRFATAMQDMGVALQSTTGSPQWSALTGADGLWVAFNSTLGVNKGAVYYTTDSLGYFNRLVFDNNGNQLSPSTSGFGPGTTINCSYNGSLGGCNANVPDPNNPGEFDSNSAFSAPFVLNKTDPTLIAIAPGYANFNGVNGNKVYIGRDTSDESAQSVDLQMTGVGTVGDGSTVLQLAYGIPASNNQGNSANPNALLAGVQTASFGGQLWFSPDVTSSQLSQLTAYTGLAPTAMVFDPTSPSAQSSPGQIRFYVADAVDLWGTTNQGTSFTSLTLPAGFNRPTSVEFISNNGVNALLVGGLNSPLTCNSTPNGCVISSQQSTIVVADSDGNGGLSSFRAFGQSLPNSWVVQLAYYPTVDVLAVGTAGRGVYALYDVTSYFPQATTLQFGLANNDSAPDASFLTDGKTLGGTPFSRPLIKYGTGTLTVMGDAAYSGSTTVNGGTLEVDGSIADTTSVTVNSGGTLSGIGIVDPPTTTIMSGGTLAPGNASNPTGTLTITGNLAFQSGALYLVQVAQSSAGMTIVSGTASLGGTVSASFSPGLTPQRQFTILESAGFNGTTFSGLSTVNEPTGFNASLTYTTHDVLLGLTAALGAGLNGNQQNTANAINNFFNNGGLLPSGFAGLYNLSGASLTAALSQLDGEDATDAQKGAFQLMNDFLNLMLDPSTGGAAIAGGGNVLGFQPEQDTTLPSEIVSAYNTMLTKAPPKPQSLDQRWTTWGSAFGGTSNTDGDPAAGTTNVNASAFGFGGGMDYQVSADAKLGFALAGGGTNWNSRSEPR